MSAEVTARLASEQAEQNELCIPVRAAPIPGSLRELNLLRRVS